MEQFVYGVFVSVGAVVTAMFLFVAIRSMARDAARRGVYVRASKPKQEISDES